MTKRLNDAQLHELALEHVQLKKRKDEVRDLIAGELAARKVRTAVIAGLTLTVTTTRELVDRGKAAALLPRAVLRRVERRAIDKRAWDRERKAGTISDEIADECVTVEDITPRLYLTQPKEQAAA